MTKHRIQKLTQAQWNEFIERLTGPEGCNFRKGKRGKTTWTCDSNGKRHLAKTILKKMGLSETQILKIIKFCDQHGGYCDCEILFNVADSGPP